MLSLIKKFARPFVAAGIRKYWSDRRALRRYGASADLKSIFSDIYATGLWGDKGRYYSGPGSGERYTGEFVRIVNDFMDEHGLTSVVDIGCGDFRVGAKIARQGIDYTGIDVFPGIIDQNIELHARPGIRFINADATKEEMPAADICIIREVLQHLSNGDIEKILAQLPRYKYAFIVEAQPAPGHTRRVNIDKRAASDCRIFFDSSVRIDQPPFSVSNVSIVSRVRHDHWIIAPGEEIVTFLVKIEPSNREICID